MAQGESPRNPLAFASVLCPGRCLAVELANSCAYWELPNGNAQRTQDPSRTFTPAEFSHSSASSVSPVAILASTTPASALASAPASAPAAAPAAEPRGGGFVVDLPYQMHNNYES